MTNDQNGTSRSSKYSPLGERKNAGREIVPMKSNQSVRDGTEHGSRNGTDTKKNNNPIDID